MGILELEVILILAIGAILILNYRLGKLGKRVRFLEKGIYVDVQAVVKRQLRQWEQRERGQENQAYVQAKISQKIAERALAVGNQSATAVAILGRCLQTRPKIITTKQAGKDEAAKKQLSQLLGFDEWDLMKSVLNDEEIEQLEQVQNAYYKKERARTTPTNGKVNAS